MLISFRPWGLRRLASTAFTATARLSSPTTPEALARLVAATTLKRLAAPTEVAAAIAFLMSPAAAYITGITLPITGGLHLNTVW